MRSSEQGLITLLQGDFNAGGVQKVFGTLANALTKQGHSVEVVVYDDRGPLRGQLDPRISVWQLHRHSQISARVLALSADKRLIPKLLRPVLFAPRSSATLPYLPSLVHYLKARRPQALFTATNYVNIEAALARQIAKSPLRLVVSQRTHLSASTSSTSKPKNARWHRRHLGPLVNWAYNDADAVVAVSQGVADDLVQRFQIDQRKITVINNPIIGPDFYDRLAEPAAHPWANDNSVPRILFVGRLAPQKDIPTLLKAFSLVRTNREARLLMIGGSGDYKSFTRQKNKVLELAGQLGLDGTLDVIGFENNPLPYMKSCSVFVLSSLFEGFGNVLVEALAAGAPVVSTDCPSGPSEILGNGKFGKLVPVGNPQALAAAILETLASQHNPTPQLEWIKRYSYNESVEQYRRILWPERYNTETHQLGRPATAGATLSPIPS